MHTIFITGGSGVVGQALIERLSALSEVECVFAASHRSRIPPCKSLTTLEADVTAGSGLGLSPDLADRVRAETTIIIHAAADTRFSAAHTDARRANVDSTRNVLDFAAKCRWNPRVIVLSTVYVAGRRTGTIYEEELDHSAGFINAYEQSKYEAEQHVRGRMAELPISVIRLSTVIGDSGGRVSRMAALHHALRFYYSSLAPMVPGTDDSLVDLVSLDYVADAVIRLAFHAFVPSRTYHICGGADCLTLGEMLDLTLLSFLNFRPAWRKRAIEKPVIVPLPAFELFVRSVEEIGDDGLRASVGLLKHFAPQLAYPKLFHDVATRAGLAEIRNPPIRDLFPRVVHHLIDCGWDPAARAMEVSCP
jgi:nucleoside-diphosphate-sugar epimerase